MNPMVFVILAWEKELEIQRQEDMLRRGDIGGTEPVTRPKEEKRKRIFTWKRPQPSCQCT